MRVVPFLGAALLPLQAFAFPSMLDGGLDNDVALRHVKRALDQLDADSKLAADVALQNRGLVGKPELVDVHGDHKWQAPGPGDLRGPCPGLNAMANHGYISRTGVDVPLAVAKASQKVFGMDFTLAFYLSVYSAVFSGDLTKFSIGGKPRASGLLSTIGLFGEPRGLSHSHNNFECDLSPTRSDMYADDNPSHNVWDVNMSRFEAIVAKPLGPHGVDATVLQPFRLEKFHESVKHNPYFWQGPYTKLALEPATYIFTFRFYGNWSEGATEGYLSRENYAMFLGIDGEPGSYTYKSGHERIPENFYKRPTDFTIPEFAVESVGYFAKYPALLTFGGNTGTPDSFVGLSPSDLTGGAYSASTLLEGDNAVCLAFQAASEGYPDLLKGGVLGRAATRAALGKVADAAGRVLAQLDCPELKEYDQNLFKKYPGAWGSY